MTGIVDYDHIDVMDMWVADLIGPINVESIGGNRYILHIVDVGSRKIISKPLKKKSDAAGIIISEMKKWEKRTGRKVIYFHSDGGKEFVNDTLTKYFKEHGITQTISTPYTPEHNGMAERFNRTSIEMSRAMLRHVISRNFMKLHEIPRKFTSFHDISHQCKGVMALWAEAFMCAAYLLDRRLSQADPKKTPIELIGLGKPNINNLHVFGCDVFYYNHKEHRENKLDVVGKREVFVGYDENNDTYFRIYDVDKNQIISIKRCKIFR